MTDFFVSYNQADRAWAEWIAWKLEAAHYSVVLQAWDFRPGHNFVLKMQQATSEAQRTIAVLSPAYLSARFTQPEWAAAFAQDPTGEKGLLVPVRVEPCDLKGLLPQIVYIDLVGRGEDQARDGLLQGIHIGRAKPTIPPAFPGRIQHAFNHQPLFPGTSDRSKKNAPNQSALHSNKGSSPDAANHMLSTSLAEQPTDFVIITALQEELQALLAKLPSYQQLPPTDEDVRVYYQSDLPITFADGTAGSYRLVLLSLLGMGRVQAANATNDAIRRWRPQYILLVGIAGGIAEAGAARGDVLIADQIVDYELQKLTTGGPQIRWEAHRASPRLLEAARHLPGEWRRLIKKKRPQRGTPQFRFGPVATGDKVVAVREVLDSYRSDWPKLIGIEMEAGGVASAAFQSAQQPGFLMVRGVSDLADQHKDDTWRQYACHAAAAFALALLQNGPVLPVKREGITGIQPRESRDGAPTQQISGIDTTMSFVPARRVERHDCYQRIHLPPHYIARPLVLEEVRRVLLSEASSTVLTSAVMDSPAALHGMGGIGKTAIARALCDDLAIQGAFPDGILWATLGQTPQFEDELRLWARTLGEEITRSAQTIDELRMAIAQLLKERACLLILDDAWRFSDVERFNLGGPHCRLLLTTRQAEIADKLGAHLQPIPLMTEDDAITLLEQWARNNLSAADRDIKAQIVKRLGYLPLAIKLAGAQLSRKSPQEWLKAFDIRKLKFFRVETAHDSLELTFSLSLEVLKAEARRLYLHLAIFQEDEAIPLEGIGQLWKSLAGINAEETTDLLDDLAAQALLEVSADGTAQTARLHDLLRDLLRLQLGANGQREAHRSLLTAYRATCKGVGWHTAPDDGYLYDHLAYHLHAAGQVQELKDLFVPQDWLRARVRQRSYTYDSYLADLSIALECASEEAREQIEKDEDPVSLVESIRYTLIRASINSIAGNYIPELIARAVALDVWMPDQAMSITAKIPPSEQQTNAYLLLLETRKLNQEQQDKAQREVFDDALRMPAEETKVRKLAKLAPFLSMENLSRIWTMAQAMDKQWACAHLCVALAPQLVGEQQTQALKLALEATSAVTNESARRDLFSNLVPHLANELLESALQAALDVTGGWTRADMLRAIAPRLPGTLLEQTLDTILTMPEKWERPRLLAILAPQLRGPLVQRAFQAALASEEEWTLARMVAALAPKLKDTLLQQALDAVLALSDDEARSIGLAALVGWCKLRGRALQQAHQAASYLLPLGRVWPAVLLCRKLGKERCAPLIKVVLEAMPAVKYKWEKADLLGALAPRLAGKMLKQALMVTLQEPDDEVRPYMLGAIAPQLKGSLVQQALNISLQERAEEIQAYMLGELAPRLSKAQLEQALQAAMNVQDKGIRLRLLEKLLPHLSENQRDQARMHALDLILSAKDERGKVEALVDLAPQLTGVSLKRALKAALDMKEVWVRERMLAALVPQLTNELLEEALQAAFAVKKAGAYVRALIMLAPRLKEEQGIQTLTAAFNITLSLSDAEERLSLLVKLVPHLTGQQRTEGLVNAIETAMVMSMQWHIAESMAALAPYLTNEQREKALQRTWEYLKDEKHEGLRARVLAALAPYLTPEQLEQAIHMALATKDERIRVEMAVILAPRLPEEQRNQILTGAVDTTQGLPDERIRATLLAALARQLTGQQRMQALESAKETAKLITDEQALAEVLIMLVPLLDGEDQTQALETALATSNEWFLTALLIALAPQLTGSAQEKAMQSALALRDEHLQAQALAAFLSVASDQSTLLKLIRQPIANVLAFMQQQALENIFQYYLKPDWFRPPVLSPESLGVLASHIIEISQEWHWQ